MERKIYKLSNQPLGTPPDNEIWYRTDNSRKIAFKSNNFDVGIKSNERVGDKWVLRLYGKCGYVERRNTNFSHLTEISFPNCAEMDSDLLNYTHKLERVKIKNANYASTPAMDGVLAKIYGVEKDKRVLAGKYFIWCRPSVLTNGSLRYVTYIKNSQFAGSDVTSLVLPKNIDDIRFNAFERCNSLETVKLIGCKYIGNEAFCNCLKLHNVFLSNELERIGFMSFGRCAFSSIRIPGNIRYIDDSAFYGNDVLHTVIFDRLKMGVEVKDFSPRMFRGCPNLKTVIVDSAEDADVIFKKFSVNDITFDIVQSINIDENGFIVKDK